MDRPIEVKVEVNDSTALDSLLEKASRKDSSMDVSTLMARILELSESNAQRDRTINEQCLRMTCLTQQIHGLRLENVSLRRKGRESAKPGLTVVNAAQEKVRLMEQELRAQATTLAAKDREIERLIEQVDDLQRAVRESEAGVEQRLKAEKDIVKALKAQLNTTDRCLREFEARYGRDGWGDIPITIYGKSLRTRSLGKPKDSPLCQA